MCHQLLSLLSTHRLNGPSKDKALVGLKQRSTEEQQVGPNPYVDLRTTSKFKHWKKTAFSDNAYFASIERAHTSSQYITLYFQLFFSAFELFKLGYQYRAYRNKGDFTSTEDQSNPLT